MVVTTEGSTLERQVPSTVTIDSGNSLFLHASDGEDQGWRRSVLIALSAQNKLGFIDGNFAEPPATANDFSTWHMCNYMVTYWLLNSLSKDIANSVIYSRTVNDLWTDLDKDLGSPMELSYTTCKRN